VFISEPALTKTPFIENIRAGRREITDNPYEESAKKFIDNVKQAMVSLAQDPAEVAAQIVEAAESTDPDRLRFQPSIFSQQAAEAVFKDPTGLNMPPPPKYLPK